MSGKEKEDKNPVEFVNIDFTAGGDKATIREVAVKDSTQQSYVGMTKDELAKYSQDPFWKNVRLTLFVLFWLLWVGMIVGAVVIIVQTPRCAPERRALKWWESATIYQVYPRSFKDSNGDGIGDLKGVEEKVDYLAEVGVDAVWLSPVYRSPMKDFGYDVSDFRDIAPIFGTLDHIKDLIKALHQKGIKLIMDFVPNHTSDQHEWFQASRQNNSADNPYRDHYVWRDPANGADAQAPLPPNNWLSVFGKSAWEYEPKRKQFYLHQFLKEQPDLNAAHPAVQQEWKDILTYWLDLGADGFRIDAIQFLHEDPRFLDEPRRANASAEGISPDQYEYLDHVYTKDLQETYDLMSAWAQHVDTYEDDHNDKEIVLITEAYSENLTRVIQYHVHGADIPFNFALVGGLRAGCGAACLQGLVSGWLDARPPALRPNWVVGNHDNSRVGTRLGPTYKDVANMLVLLLPGTPTSYYGEEIGMEDVEVSFVQTQDPFGLNFGPDKYKEFSRDPERSPMQWSRETHAGFSANASVTPWLPVNNNYLTGINVQEQLASNRSHLDLYKRLVGLRRGPAFLSDLVEFGANNDTLFTFVRRAEAGLQGPGAYLVLLNFGPGAKAYSEDDGLTHPEQGTIELTHSGSVTQGYKAGEKIDVYKDVFLQPGEGYVIKF